MRRPIVRVFFTLFAAMALVLAGGVAASADTSDFSFASFNADYTLTRGDDNASKLAVVETLVATFPDFDQNRGLLRAIPQYYRGVDLHTAVESVVDENGAAVPFSTSVQDEFTVVALGDDSYVHGDTTYVISYTQVNVVGAFANTGDEFYWDVNGTGWSQSFGNVSATVHVDPSLTSALTGDSRCYRGALNSTTECALTTGTAPATGGAIFSADESTFGSHENLSVDIGFVAGTFLQAPKTQPEPPSFDNAVPWWSRLISIVSLLAAAAFAAISIVGRIRRGRGAKGRGIIVPQYSVPKNLNVMVAAHLVNRSSTAIPAQLVSLAVRKNLRILDYPVTAGGAEYTLQYLGDDGTDELERQLLSALFGVSPEAGTLRELLPNDEALGEAVNAVSSAARDALSTTGLRDKWRPGGCLPLVGAVVLLVLGIITVVATAFAGAFSILSLAAVGAAIVLMFTTVLLVQKTGLLTTAGAEQREYLLGMQVYLKLAEQERFRMLQSPDGAERIDVGDTKQIIKLYEKLLPFAVIWGVEDQWAHELEIRVAAEGVQPDWFTGRNGFSTLAFTSALSGVSQAASYVPPSTSSSWTDGSGGGSSFGSSFGGSSGGGFSGGGGGGGGGGGR